MFIQLLSLLTICVVAVILFLFGFGCGVFWFKSWQTRHFHNLMDELQVWTERLLRDFHQSTGNHIQYFKQNILRDLTQAQQEAQERSWSGYDNDDGDDDGDNEFDMDDSDDDPESNGFLN